MAQTQTKNILIGGIVIIAILIVIKFAFFPQITSEKTITSTGTSEIIIMPDTGEVYARIEVLKETAKQAEEESKKISDLALTKAKEFDAKIETLSYNLYKREDWTPNGTFFKGYIATYSLKISTQKLDQIGRIVDTIVSSGVNFIDNIQFTLSKDKENEIKREALKKAGEITRQKAEAIAEGLGFKLGKIVKVSESEFFYPPIMYAEAVAEIGQGRKAAELKFEPQEIKVTATLHVEYSIRT